MQEGPASAGCIRCGWGNPPTCHYPHSELSSAKQRREQEQEQNSHLHGKDRSESHTCSDTHMDAHTHTHTHVLRLYFWIVKTQDALSYLRTWASSPTFWVKAEYERFMHPKRALAQHKALLLPAKLWLSVVFGLGDD